MASVTLGKYLEYVKLLLQPSITRSSSLFICLQNLYDFVLGNIQKLGIFMIEEPMKNSSSSATILLMGCRETAHQLAKVVCSRNEEIHSLGRAFCWQVHPASFAGVTILCTPKHYTRKFSKPGCFLLPIVNFSLDLRGPIDQIMSRMSGRRRRDARKLLAYGYSYTVSRDEAKDFDFFYREMYVPYTRNRFQKAAYVMTYSRCASFYKRNGGILFVKNREKPVSGILFQITNKAVYAMSLGIYKGDNTLVRNFAGQAALLFLVKWAKAQGLEELNYGETMPFLKDGLFTYKKEWGMAIDGKIDRCLCTLSINQLSEETLCFLRQNPFIFLDRGKIKALVFEDHKITETELSQISSEYSVRGLDSLIIISYEAASSERPEPELHPFRSLSTDLPRPVDEICARMRKQGFQVAVLSARHK